MGRNISTDIFSSNNIQQNTAKIESITEKPIQIISNNLNNIISLNNITQIFNPGTVNEYKLFENFNIDFPKGKIISIMGQSGSGKTQLLRLITGLSKSENGTVTINQKDKSIPMVFQQYSSFPWMTVLDNIALPLKLSGMSWADARKHVDMFLIDKVGLRQHMYKYAKQPALSGGQLQRVSIARCLAENSKIILFDEATGALDIKMKADIDDLILQIHQEDPESTIINVTHSPEEAVYLSDIIYILQANPCRIYHEVNINPSISNRKNWKEDPNSDFHNYTKEVIDILNIICK